MSSPITADDVRTDELRTVAPEHRSRVGGLTRGLLVRPEMSLVVVIIAIGAYAESRSSIFLTRTNITDIADATVIYAVMACGSALLMIGGGLDFSIGATFTLGGVACAWLLVHGLAWPLAVLGGVGAGTIVGLANFAIISRLHVPPIIATLGTFFILEGVNVQITGGNDILPLPQSFQNLGQGEVFGVPYIVWYAIVIAIVCWFLLELTRFGVNVRALGGNRQAAVANRIRVHWLDARLYLLSAVTAAFAGVIYSAEVGSGQVEAGGAGTTLTVVTAVLIGGVSLLGGLGTMTGVAIGAILLSVIDNALVIAQIPPQYNDIVVGSILIAAVAFDYLRRQRLYRR
jgi:ribose transport system permease protein